jgi:hypothetical protein
MLAIFLAAAIAQAPPAVRGDFDHDGKADLAKIVHVRGDTYRLVIRRGAQGHSLATIDTLKAEDLPNFFLGKAKPGRWATWCGKGGDDGDGPCRRKFVDLRRDTLSFGTRESSEAVALWTGHRFKVVWLSD